MGQNLEDQNLEKLYMKYAGPVKKFVLSLGAPEHVADDITSDTFLKALKHINSYDENRSMLTWLCQIAKNTYFDHLRRRDNGSISLEDIPYIPPDTSSPLSVLLDDERNRTLYKGIKKLPEPYKDIIYLRMFTDMSFGDIGEIFDKNENWARVTFYRGKLKLKELIENEI